jgi:hypothetical protein
VKSGGVRVKTYADSDRIVATLARPSIWAAIVYQLVLRSVLVDDWRRGRVAAKCPSRTHIEAFALGRDCVGSLALVIVNRPCVGAVGLRLHGAYGPVVAGADGHGGGCRGEGEEDGGEMHLDCVE